MLCVCDVESGDATAVLCNAFWIALLAENSLCDVDKSLNFVVIFVFEDERIEIVAVVDGGLYGFSFVERSQVVPPSRLSCDVCESASCASDVFWRSVVWFVVGCLADFFERRFGVVPLSLGAGDVVE